MDRLEAVEIRRSNLEFSIRIDAEYYQKPFLNYQNIIYSQKYILLDKLVNFIIGPFGSSFLVDNYSQDTTYRYIRGRDVKPFYLKDDENAYILKRDYDRLSKYSLQNEDLLISVVGTLGNVSIVTNKEIPAIFSCKSTLIRCIKIDPFFLLTYLNTRMIKNLLLRRTRGTVQTGLNLDDLKNIEIIYFSDKIQSLINKLCHQSKQYIDNSNSLYSSAEKLLLSHLGLDNYTPSSSGIVIKSLSESFGASGRLDSEYYLPKYEETIQAISNHKQEKLGNIVTIKKSIEPGSESYGDNGIPFVRISNLSKYEISEPDIKIPINIVPNIEKLYPQKDTILLSKDGSVGIAYKVTREMQCVTSGAILHLNVKNKKEILSDYLTLVLNSKIVQIQAERDAGGSIIQHWKPSEIENVKIPVLDISIQSQIAEKVQESFTLRKKSTELLELAKTAVEVAIEQGEEKAMQMLQNQI